MTWNENEGRDRIPDCAIRNNARKPENVYTLYNAGVAYTTSCWRHPDEQCFRCWRVPASRGYCPPRRPRLRRLPRGRRTHASRTAREGYFSTPGRTAPPRWSRRSATACHQTPMGSRSTRSLDLHRTCTSAALTHFAQSSKMGTVTMGFDAKMANRPFLVFDFRALCRALNPERPSARKSKTKNGRLASLA